MSVIKRYDSDNLLYILVFSSLYQEQNTHFVQVFIFSPSVLMIQRMFGLCVSLRYDNAVGFPQLCISVSWVPSLAAGHSSDLSGEEEPPGILHQERCLSARRNLPRWNPAVRYTHTRTHTKACVCTHWQKLVSRWGFFNGKSLKQF